MIRLIDDKLLNEVVDEARQSPRLRMNYNFHEDLSDGCQRLLNAMEPGTLMPIHHHKVDEIWVVLRGRLRLTIHDDYGVIVDSYELSAIGPMHGANIPAGTWHSLVCLETGTVILECKEGPYIPHEVGGVLEV